MSIVEEVIINFRTNLKAFNNVMNQSMVTFRNNRLGITGMESAGAKLANRIRMLTHGMRGFRMEMLGVMFFGMSMQRFFSGLIKPAAELFGIFDIWRISLQTLFIPIMEELMSYFIDFATWIIDLPEPVKKLVGELALFGLVLGIMVMLLGMLALGIGSLILVGFGPLIAILAIAAVAFVGLFLIVKGVCMVIKKKWEGIGLIIMGVGIILLLFIGWWALIPIAVGAAAYLIVKHWEWVEATFTELWKKMEMTFWMALGNMLVGLKKYIDFMTTVPILGVPFKWISSGLDTIIEAIRFGEGQAWYESLQARYRREEYGIAKSAEEITPKAPKIPIVINQNNTYQVPDTEEMDRKIEENNKKLVEDMKKSTDLAV